MVALAAFGLIWVVLGAYVMKRAFTVRKRANLVEETPTEKVGSISMGQSEIKGSARPTDEGTITAPFTDDDCLVAVWEVREFTVTEGGRGEGKERKWRHLGNGVDYVPFLVDDGTGQALVRPSGENLYEIEQDREGSTLVQDGQSPPSRIEEFLERDDWRGTDLTEEVWSSGAWDTEGYSSGDRFYKQHLITPDEDVYVFGVAQPRDDVSAADNAANVVVETVPEGDEDLEDMFLISDKDEEELAEHGGKQWYLTGVVLAAVGVAMMGADVFV